MFIAIDSRTGGANLAVGREDHASRDPRKRDDTLSERSRNRYIGGACRAPVRSARPRRRGRWRQPGPRNSRDTSRGDATRSRRATPVATAAAARARIPGTKPQSLVRMLLNPRLLPQCFKGQRV